MELAINIKNTREQHWVKIEDILYIQSEGNDCHFVTTKEEFKFRITLKKAMDLIDEYGDFGVHHCARVDKSHIINLNHVSKVIGFTVVLSNGDTNVSVPIAADSIRPLKARLLEIGKNMQLSFGTGLLNLNSNVSTGVDVYARARIGAVDLGLPSGLKWGDHNFCNRVPACKPEEYGDHVSWGETASKESFDKETDYLFSWGQEEGFEYDEDGEVYDWDASNQLPDVFDVAHKTHDWRYGRNWHIPTKQEWEELCQYCKFTWCNTVNGTRGVLVTGLNGNTIFLPAAGYSKEANLNINKDHELAYWSSTYGGQDAELLDTAFAIRCKDDISGQSKAIVSIEKCTGFMGLSVRPVYGGSMPSSQSKEIKWEGDFEYRKTRDDTCMVSRYLPERPYLEGCETIKDYVTFGNNECKVVGIYDDAYDDILHIGCRELVIPATIEELDPKNIHVSENINVHGDNPAYSSIDGVLFDKGKKVLLRYPDGRDSPSYLVPDGVETIGEYAFSDCCIEKIDTNKVTHICEHAFEPLEEFYDSISEFYGPYVKRIDSNAFASCRQLKTVEMPCVESFGINVFTKCDLREVTLPVRLKELHSYVFICDKLQTVTMKGMPETVSNNPFSRCPNLKTVILFGISYTLEAFIQRITQHKKK